MKTQIRSGVFETNSSAIHSITICTQKEYSDWLNDMTRMLNDYPDNKFLPKDEAIEENIKILMKEYELTDKNSEHRELIEKYRNTGDIEVFDELDEYFDKGSYYLTYDEWDSYFEYEKYAKKYITESNDEIIAFGYYGHDY